KAYAETSRALAARDYWTGVLAADRRKLPCDFAHGKNTVGSIAAASREIAFERSVAPAQGGARAQSIFLAALGAALEEWAGSGSMLVDLEGHGRACAGLNADLSRTVG